MTADAVPAVHTPRYRRRLLFLVSAATFFEGYDNVVLSFVLALGDLGASEAQAGWVRAMPSHPGATLPLLALNQGAAGRPGECADPGSPNGSCPGGANATPASSM